MITAKIGRRGQFTLRGVAEPWAIKVIRQDFAAIRKEVLAARAEKKMKGYEEGRALLRRYQPFYVI